jgi:hypothetical protein
VITEAPDELEAAFAYGWHPVEFAERVLGVLLNPAQKRWFQTLVPLDRWRWSVYQQALVSGNQTGKTLGIAILILWANHNKIGVDPSDGRTWLDSPYNWYHLGPDQNTAYLPLRDIGLLLKGTHPAQLDKTTGKYRKCLLPEGFVSFKNVETYYDGIEFWNGAVVQFRTTDDKAKALQGRRAWGISYDECAYEDHLSTVVNETLLMRLISTGGPLILVSTPNGINDWFEIVETIRDAGKHPSLEEDQVWITEPTADGRRDVLVWATTYDNAGFGLSADEIKRREDSGVSAQTLRGMFLEPDEAFFVPSASILEAFREDAQLEAGPEPKHRYVIFWDPSVASDPTACYVLDVTREPWRVVHEVWERKPTGIASLIRQMFGLHTQYQGEKNSSASITGYDSTGMGGAIIRQALVGLHPTRPLDFAGTSRTKDDVLGNLRMALLSGRLVVPASLMGLRREILNYRRDDKKITQDRVIALAGAAWIASKGFSGAMSASFSPHARVSNEPMWR